MVYDVFIRIFMTVFLVLGRNNTVEDSVFLSVLCFFGGELFNLYADVIIIWLKKVWIPL